MPGAVFTVLPAGVVLGLVLGIVLVVPAPTAPVPAPVVTPPVALGVVTVVVLGVVMPGAVIVDGHSDDAVVPLIVPVVPVDGLGIVTGLFAPMLLLVPPIAVAEPSVEPPVDGVVHGVINWGDGIDGDVGDVPMPVGDWVPAVCAANPIDSVRIANVSHVVRILSPEFAGNFKL